MNPLFAAARALEKHGWVNEAAGSPEHGMCLLGALGWVTGCPLGVEIQGAPPPQRDLFWQAMDLLHDVVEELFGCNQVAWVNDNLVADQDQAVAILEKAGARLEEAA
ncbi:MAG: hypothetical protein M3N32_07915 [Actinomycetota bacterium]|nr:hypothetical protein [Actinomycetota bacterium]